MLSMKIEEIMTRNVRSCGPNDTLNSAAQIMWDCDCGCVPVVDDMAKAVGMITDRDVCMAAHFQGAPLAAVPVGAVMATDLAVCHPEDTVATVAAMMRARQVRRLPVVDADGRLVGVVSLADVARAAAANRRAVRAGELAETLEGICTRRASERSLAA
jgi:CBS domain-containing protein